MNIFLQRWIKASQNSLDGFKVLLNERAFREELFFTILGLILIFLLPFANLLKLMLVILLGILLIVEAFNSAIEATIDRISTDIHPLSKAAKDIGSATVSLAIIINIIAWCYALWTIIDCS